MLLIVADILILAVSFVGANFLYLSDINSAHGVTMFMVIAPIYVGLAAMTDAYSGLVLERSLHGVARTIRAYVLAGACVMFIAYFLKASSEFSRAVFALGSLGSIILLPLGRLALGGTVNRLLGGTPYATLMIRDGVEFESSGNEIVVDSDQLDFDPASRDPHSFHTFAGAVAHADRLIVACPPERYLLWSSVLKSMAIDGEIVADDHDPLGIIGIGRYAGRTTMAVARGPLHLRDRILKRCFDLVLAGVAVVALAPLLLAVAIAIRMESKGPILFKQDRIGRDNKIFRIYKFRSMYTDMCDTDADRLTTRADPRVTRIGQFIRKSSIDELPQLLNVLNGDMSLVGPRPHPLAAKAADQLYWDVDPRYRYRHSMKPGLTGLAQVRGFRGNTERTEDLTNRLQSDLEYAVDWSIWKDLQIIFQTFLVLRHDNAF